MKALNTDKVGSKGMPIPGWSCVEYPHEHGYRKFTALFTSDIHLHLFQNLVLSPSHHEWVLSRETHSFNFVLPSTSASVTFPEDWSSHGLFERYWAVTGWQSRYSCEGYCQILHSCWIWAWVMWILLFFSDCYQIPFISILKPEVLNLSEYHFLLRSR